MRAIDSTVIVALISLDGTILGSMSESRITAEQLIVDQLCNADNKNRGVKMKNFRIIN